jgi:hypothetical protein
MFDLMKVIDERDLERRQIEMDLDLDPFQMGFRPGGLHGTAKDFAVGPLSSCIKICALGA